MTQTHAFDAQVRVLECRHCGAPAMMRLTEGQFECGYCGAVNLYSVTADSRPPTEQPRPRQHADQPPVGFDPGAIAAIEATLTDLDHAGWVRGEVSRATGPAALDVTANAPADLPGFTVPVTWSTWKSQRIPALRQSWQQAVQGAEHGSLDAGSQHRMYWLALRLNDGYSVTAKIAHDAESRDEEMLKRRAVLETALQHLEATPYGAVLRCRLSRAACHVGDVDSAQAWLASCPPKPDTVEVDGEMRLALCTVRARQNDPKAILALLEPGGTPIPLRIPELEPVAVVYRVHAHEALGDLGQSRRVLREGCARFETAVIRGHLMLEQVAPKARARLFWRLLIKVLVVVALIITVVVLLFR